MSPLSSLSPLSPLSPLSFTSEMDFNPFQDSSNFVELLNSQQNVVFGNVADTVSLSSSEVPKNVGKPPAERKEQRIWTPTDDIVLISLWLNTSKYSVVGNEQKSIAFWTRVTTYFSASPKLAGCERREGSHCKQRWHKLNDLVCKFYGAYEAATREKSSGMNENDVLKLSHEIFFSNHKRGSHLNMLGMSFEMTRSGVKCLVLKLKAAPKGESVGMVHVLQARK